MAETSILPVVVGGLLGIGGVAVTGLVTIVVNYRESLLEKKKRRADKFEELVTAVYEFDHWIDNQRRKRAYGEDRPETISPFAKIQSIASVYFPQLTSKLVH
jgi:hypothetical protein